jgi:hypothetical protein
VKRWLGVHIPQPKLTQRKYPLALRVLRATDLGRRISQAVEAGRLGVCQEVAHRVHPAAVRAVAAPGEAAAELAEEVGRLGLLRRVAPQLAVVDLLVPLG